MGTQFGQNPKSHDFHDFWSSPARFKEDFSRSATLPRNVQILSGKPLPRKVFFEHCLGWNLLLAWQFLSSASNFSFFSFLPLFVVFSSALLLSCPFLFNFHALLGFFYHFRLVFYKCPCLYLLACFFFRSSIDLFVRLLVGWFACLLCGFFVSQGCSIVFLESSVTAVMCAE